MQKIKNNEAWPKFSSSYKKKKRVYGNQVLLSLQVMVVQMADKRVTKVFVAKQNILLQGTSVCASYGPRQRENNLIRKILTVPSQSAHIWELQTGVNMYYEPRAS